MKRLRADAIATDRRACIEPMNPTRATWRGWGFFGLAPLPLSKLFLSL